MSLEMTDMQSASLKPIVVSCFRQLYIIDKLCYVSLRSINKLLLYEIQVVRAGPREGLIAALSTTIESSILYVECAGRQACVMLVKHAICD